jgi:two-component system sensor histidine kinase/response regulator
VSEEHLRATIADLERRLEASEHSARALSDSERLYRSLFEGMASAVTIRSLEDQSFIDCNPGALRLYRAESVEQLRGSRVTQLSPERQSDGTLSRDAFRLHVDRAIATGSERCEWLARRLDGTPFIADVRIAVLRLEDGRQIMQTMIDDITERKAAEALLRRRAERDEVMSRISRRFLEGDLDDAKGFAIESLASFFRVDGATVARWIDTAGAPDALEADTEDVALVRLAGEMIAMAQARRQIQLDLRASEERYRTVVDRCHDTIAIFGPDGCFSFVNPAGQLLVGYGPEELIGKPLDVVAAPDERHRVPQAVADGRAGLVQSPTEWNVARKDGSIVRIESVRSPMHDHAGNVIGAIVVARDISERHRADQMREEAQRELAKAKEDAIAASAAKSVFVANMSHELRTPLNGVIGMVDLLSRTTLDGRQKRYVEVARVSATLLLSVINDILDFSKIEAGKLELEHVEFSLRDVVEEVTTMCELSAEEKSLELSCTTDPALDAPCAGDPARVRQILVNIISNAIKFTSRGEVTVRATPDGESEGGRRVRIEVRDTGVGMTREAQDKLFRPFSQVDASTTRQHGGTGLGLAICQQLVHRMGGEIGVASAPGAGSTFWFTLRFDRAVGGQPATDADARLLGVRVLAVDDNATNREILRVQLTAAGMHCDIASSGDEALAMLTAAARRGDPYVLAILDQHMPAMDGCELARRIKADARIASTRLMMLGSMGRPLDPEQLQALGILTWATKPVWRIKLLRALGSALDEAPSEDARAPDGPVATEASQPALPGGAPARVLLVEDTPINAEVVVEILRIAGYATDVASDGLTALDALRGAPYDVVLMDCQLPGIDGYETTRRIRALEASGDLGSSIPADVAVRVPRLPILALTASATREDLERARLSGMDDHISKPVDARRLLDALAGHLGRRPGTLGAEPAAARPNGDRVVDLARALDRVQGNRNLLERIVAQFRAEVGETRGHLHDCLERRSGDELGFAVHRLRGQALSLDAGRLAVALGKLEEHIAQRQWAASTSALQEVDREIDQVVDALAPR